MVTLEKLGILGIRSFSPESLEVLSFERPFTLIVGHNGAGKTTIVECLRMATTGELPPNAGKGQYFVHNTDQLDTPEVKGQIRLVFKAGNDRKILANRSFQLLTTRDRRSRIKTSFKALESVLQVKDADGIVRSLNKKCSQMDHQVPYLMGTSPAILANVVFCHQEESYWPLGDMTTLKKKFDDIFGATRYSRALSLINILRKDHQKIIKDKQQELLLVESLKEQAYTLRKKIEDANTKHRELQQRLKRGIELLVFSPTPLQPPHLLVNQSLVNEKNQFEDAKRKLDLSKEYQVKLHVIQDDLIKCRQDRDACRSHFVEGHQQYLNTGQDDLITKKTNMLQNLQDEKEALKCCKESIETMELKLEHFQKKKNQMEMNSQKLIRVQERCEAHQKRMDDALQRFVDDCPKMDTSSTQSVVLSITGYEKQLKQSLLKKEKTMEIQIKTKSDVLHTHRNAILSLTDAKGKHQSSIEEVKLRLQETRKILAQKPHTIDLLHRLELDIKGILEKEEQHDLEVLERRIQNLRQERNALQKEAQDFLAKQVHQTTRDWDKNTSKSSSVQRDTILKLARALFCTCFQEERSSGLLSTAKVALELQSLRTVLETERQLQMDCSRLEGYCLSLKHMIEELDKRHCALHKDLNRQGTQNVDFVSLLRDQKKEVTTCLKQLLIAQCAPKFYTNHLQESVKKKKCFFCLESIETIEKIERIRERTQLRIDSFPDKIDKQRELLEKAELEMQRLEGLHKSISDLKHITELLQECKEKKEKMEAEQAELQLQLSALKTTHGDRQKKEHMLVQLEGYLLYLEKEDPIVEYNGPETNDGHRQCATDDLSPTLEDVHERLLVKNQSIEASEKEMENKRKLLELLRSQRFALEKRLVLIKEKCATIEQAVATERSLVMQLDSLQVEYSSLLNQLETCRLRCDESQADVNNITETLRWELDEARKHLNMVTEKVAEYCVLEKEHKEFQRDLLELQITPEDYHSFVTCVDTTNKELVAMRSTQNHHDNQLRYFEEHIKLMEDVLSLFALQHKLETAEVAHQRLSMLLKDKENQPAYLQQTVDSLTKKIQSLSSEHGSILGEQKASAVYREQHETELQYAKYKDVDQRYQNATIECETESMTVRDLQRYSTALDRALMKYHTLKMQTINKTMRELWQSIYKGRDIDYISIRSDTEDDIQVTSTGQRSYNYRVMMTKDGTHELEMRGRCSAGQKVLASIVIRLALAESFSVNCGILALDEPTTNLDECNMQGLARALADLINSRKNCAHFQLILITHDEAFVRMLARHQPCDTFFQISKNKAGYSVIRRADIQSF